MRIPRSCGKYNVTLQGLVQIEMLLTKCLLDAACGAVVSEDKTILRNRLRLDLFRVFWDTFCLREYQRLDLSFNCAYQ